MKFPDRPEPPDTRCWIPVSKKLLQLHEMSADKVNEEPVSSWDKAKSAFTHKPASGFYDPCQDFADRSIKCMRRNGNDRTMCSDYFQ
ncbi:cytochrome c oxidase-assembly factor COX23, mitochondrial [Emergomyces pasteurianus Ep9510]|uniref:Cytochrome c oxidase-assembly factor COX23, mitochondrial n=1 Tax=Emergomyces pasteurianus Ep9510 TaxID=1447872 RepID=A0A1J9PQH7_9EURO|nr:cytochrome c oxidase-assembly factor COX23, mitochondrial [Emergomyces pasteurianus Ep9510]